VAELPLAGGDAHAYGHQLAAILRRGADALVLTSAGYVNVMSPAAEKEGTAPKTYRAALVLDQRVVKGGDALHVAGYLRQVTPGGGASTQLPAGVSRVFLQVSPGWAPAGGGADGADGGGEAAEAPRFEAAVDAAFGSFRANISVPSDARFGAYGLSVVVPLPDAVAAPAPEPEVQFARSTAAGGGQEDSVASSIAGSSGGVAMPAIAARGAGLKRAPRPVDMRYGFGGFGGGLASAAVEGGGADFVIADPRPPTASLAATLPPWVPPRGVATLSVSAASYIGASVGGASLSAVWTAGGRGRGELNITTDASGAGAVTIDLGALPADEAPAEGDSLSVSVEWIGPTRERIVAAADARIAPAPLRLELRRSLETELPGVAFGVAVDVFSNVDGGAVPGARVRVSLAPAANASVDAACAAASKDAACDDLPAGFGGYAACQLALPCVGEFELRACVAAAAEGGGGGDEQPAACTTLPLGRNATSWERAPWQAHDAPPLLVDDARVLAPGDTARAVLQNPWAGASGLLLWGPADGALSRSVRAELGAPGLATLDFGPLGPECAAGCSVALVVSVPRAAAGEGEKAAAVAPRGVRVSALFDPAAPHVHSAQLALRVDPARRLSVALSSPSASAPAPAPEARAAAGGAPAPLAVAQPGDVVPLAAAVTRGGAGGGGGPAAAEVIFIAVDRALLDLLPHPPPDVAGAMAPRLDAYFGFAGTEGLRVSPAAVDAVFAALLRRLRADPWAPVDASVQPGGGMWYGRGMFPGGGGGYAAAVDQSDAEFFGGLFTDVTLAPGRRWRGGPFLPMFGGRPQMAMASAAMVARDGGAESAADASFASNGGAAKAAAAGAVPPSSGGASVRLQSAFEATALFATAVAGADGVAAVNFTAPQGLGRYVVRAYAASPDAAYGSAEAEVLVRRRLSLTPSSPRFVRLGDEFTAGVIVTRGGDADAAGEASLAVELRPVGGVAALALRAAGDAAAAATTTTLAVKFAAGEAQVEARVPLTAAALGVARLRVSATDGGADGGDALEMEFTVEAPQGAVEVATSFALRYVLSSGAWQLPAGLPARVRCQLAACRPASLPLLTAVRCPLSLLTPRAPQVGLQRLRLLAGGLCPAGRAARRQPAPDGRRGAPAGGAGAAARHAAVRLARRRRRRRPAAVRGIPRARAGGDARDAGALQPLGGRGARRRGAAGRAAAAARRRRRRRRVQRQRRRGRRRGGRAGGPGGAADGRAVRPAVHDVRRGRAVRLAAAHLLRCPPERVRRLDRRPHAAPSGGQRAGRPLGRAAGRGAPLARRAGPAAGGGRVARAGCAAALWTAALRRRRVPGVGLPVAGPRLAARAVRR